MSDTAPPVAQVAPTGRLRVVINLGNPVLAQGTPAEPRGVTVALAHELARWLDVPLDLECVDAARKSYEAITEGRVDLCFLADEATDVYEQQGLEVVAGVRQPMAEYVAATGRRILEPPFMEINQAVGLPRGLDPEAVEAVAAHVEELKASGFVEAELARSGVSASVAPPAPLPHSNAPTPPAPS